MAMAAVTRGIPGMLDEGEGGAGMLSCITKRKETGLRREYTSWKRGHKAESREGGHFKVKYNRQTRTRILLHAVSTTPFARRITKPVMPRHASGNRQTYDAAYFSFLLHAGK